jgi:aquaporin rerated protein, other eukaryote
LNIAAPIKYRLITIMPSTFPPPSVERHHSRRRSGRHDDVEAQAGNYSNRPGSGHYNDPAYQPRVSHDNNQDPYYQATSAAGAYQTLDPNGPQQNHDPDQMQHNNQQDSSHPPAAPQNTFTYQPPTHHHAPHSNTQPQGPARKPNHGLSFFNRNRGSRISGRNSGVGPGGGHTLTHQPSPLAYKSQGGRWEDIRAHLVAMSGEFFGTIFFLWFALSAAQVAAMTNPDPNGLQTPQTLLYISLGFGMSLLVSAWAFYRISGGLFNPAVVLGMCVSGSLPWIRGAFLIPAELLGSMIAAALVQCMFPGDVGAVITKLAPGVSIARGVFIEMFLTTLLVFVILMLAAEKHQATFIAPVGIGLALFVAELTGEQKPSTGSDRCLTDCRTRCLLHWRLSQPCSVIWPLRRCSILSRPSLDLLDWSMLGCPSRRCILQTCQVPELRRGEPGAGCQA